MVVLKRCRSVFHGALFYLSVYQEVVGENMCYFRIFLSALGKYADVLSSSTCDNDVMRFIICGQWCTRHSLGIEQLVGALKLLRDRSFSYIDIRIHLLCLTSQFTGHH